jgi:hypothetical protein
LLVVEIDWVSLHVTRAVDEVRLDPLHDSGAERAV